jgi:hypothetical protein
MGVRVRVKDWNVKSCNAIGPDWNVKFVFGRMRQLHHQVGPHCIINVNLRIFGIMDTVLSKVRVRVRARS